MQSNNDFVYRDGIKSVSVLSSISENQSEQELQTTPHTQQRGSSEDFSKWRCGIMLTPEQRTQLTILGYTQLKSRVRVRCFAAKGMPLDEQLKRGIAWQKDERNIIPSPVEGWLYPNLGDGVFVRLRKKKADDGKVELDANSNAIWIAKKTYQDGIGHLKSLNSKGYGIYLIPNEGGGADADITRFPALFYECDEVGKDEQWQRLRSLEAELGDASMVIETRSSLHCYFALVDGSVPAATWIQYQQRLIQKQDSDGKIWNPSRLMRLCGFDHQKWNVETQRLEQFPVRLVKGTSNGFALDDFNEILPRWDESRWQEQKTSKRASRTTVNGSYEAFESDHNTVLWAEYQYGYNPHGRPDWITCQDPLIPESDRHLHSIDSLHIHKESGALKLHRQGSDLKAVYKRMKEIAEKAGYQEGQRCREEQKRDSTSLTAEERDRNIREIHSQLGLKEGHRLNLRDRGFTDTQIDQGKYFSVSPWAKVRGINPNLAGLDSRGGHLQVANHGIGCPIWNEVGLIIGFQIRLDDVLQNKYRWASSRSQSNPYGATSHLQNSELPISCCRPVGGVTRRESIGLAEGFLKPYIASQKLGQVMLGASSGNFAGSPEQLKKYLDSLSLELGTKTVDLYPDAGSLLNNKIIKANKQTTDLIQSWGYTVRVAWWEQDSNEASDIDELDNFDEIIYKTTAEFYKQANDAQYWQRVVEEQQKLSTLTYPVNLLLDQKYLPDDLYNLIPNTGIVTIKAPKGTGKSVAIKTIIKKYVALGFNVISITPRVALGRSQASEWDIQWFNDLREVNDYKLGICWDSLHKLTKHGNCYYNTIVVIDECEQGFKHLATSLTCVDNRPEIMQSFQNIIRCVLEFNGLVLLSDADLSNVSVDYVKSLSPANTPIFSVVNCYKGKPWDVEIYKKKRGSVEEDILNALAAGEKIAIATDSQREAEALDKELAEEYPDKKIIRIDRKTCAEQCGKEFIQAPNKEIEIQKPDCLIYTPSMGVGVSLDGVYFDKVFGLFFAVIEPKEACQMLARVRDPNVPRIIWAKEFTNDILGCKSLFPTEVSNQLWKNHKLTTDIINLVEYLASEKYANLLSKLNALFDPVTETWKTPHIDLYTKVKARNNYGLRNFAKLLVKQLEAEGHCVYEDIGMKTGIGDIIASTKEDLKVEESEAIANAEVINIKLAKQILRNPNANEKERYKARRAILAEMLPGIDLTPQFVLKAQINDHGKWLTQTILAWKLANPSKTAILDRKHWYWHLEKAEIAWCWDLEKSKVYLPDVKTVSIQVDTLKSLGIHQFLNPEMEFSSANDEIVTTFMDEALKQRKRVKTAFDLTVTDKTSAVQFIGRLLERIGLSLENTRREGERGNEIRFYGLSKESYYDTDRLAVLQALSLKHEKQSEEKPEPRRQHSPISINKVWESAGDEKPHSNQGFQASEGVKNEPEKSLQNLENVGLDPGLSSTSIDRGDILVSNAAKLVPIEADVTIEDSWGDPGIDYPEQGLEGEGIGLVMPETVVEYLTPTDDQESLPTPTETSQQIPLTLTSKPFVTPAVDAVFDAHGGTISPDKLTPQEREVIAHYYLEKLLFDYNDLVIAQTYTTLDYTKAKATKLTLEQINRHRQERDAVAINDGFSDYLYLLHDYDKSIENELLTHIKENPFHIR